MSVGSRDENGFYESPNFNYHNYLALKKFLEELHDNYPNITRLYSIGKSVKGRELYVLEITKEPSKHDPEKPDVRYVGNIHGNEAVGREVLLLLCKYLCENYGTDSRITRILNGIKLHVLPSLNPDGYELANENDYSGNVGRSNAHGIVIDDNFAQYEKHQNESSIETEVLSIIKWMSEMEFVLSGTFHGGATITSNYPYGTIITSKREHLLDSSPEEDVFAMLTNVYVSGQPSTSKNGQCPDYSSDYIVPVGVNKSDGMHQMIGAFEEYSYRHHHTFDVAIEMGCYKYPKATRLHEYWRDNLESLLRFIEAAKRGLYGSVRSSIGGPIANAEIKIQGRKVTISTSSSGYYRWLLPPGNYTVTANASNYEPLTQNVKVPSDNGELRLDFTLIRNDPFHWIHLNDYDLRDNLKNGYLKNKELNESYKKLEMQKPSVAEFKADDSPISAAIHSFKITNHVGNSEETKIRIGFIGGLFASQPIGREILIRFARHILRASQEEIPFVTKLLDRIVLYLIPGVDPAFDKVTDSCNPAVNDEVGKRLYSAKRGSQLDVVTNALEQLFLTEDFDALVLFGGGSGINVSYASNNIDFFKDFVTYYQKSVQISKCETQYDDIKNVQNYIKDKYKIPVMSFSLSCCKYPEAQLVPIIWRENLLPLKNLIKRLSTGVLIAVRDSDNNPLRETIVRVGASVYNVSKNMAYFKAILPSGIYDAAFSCKGYGDQSAMIIVRDDELTRLNIILIRSDSTTDKNQHISENRNEAYQVLNDLNIKYPKFSTLHEIGVSKNGHKIMALEIHPKNNLKNAIDRPSMVFSAGAATRSFVTSKIIIHLATHILTNYNIDSQIINYVQNFSIFVVPTLNPDSNNKESCSYIPENILQFPLESGKIEYYENARTIAKWLDRVKPIVVVNLRVGSLHIEIPYGSRLGKNSQKPYITDDEEILQRLALAYTLNHPSMSLVNSRCGSRVIVENSGMAHMGVASRGTINDSLLDYLYLKAGALPLEAYIACCDDDDDIRVWMENKRSLLAIVSEAAKNVAGYVVNEANEPVVGATLTHDHSTHRIQSQANGAYWLLLTPGTHSIEIDAPGFYQLSKSVNVTDERNTGKLILKLKRITNIVGMPRVVFVIMTGAVLIVLMIGCIFAITKYQSKHLKDKNSRRPYAFSLLRDGNAFFDDDEKEVQIFKRPCKEYKEELSKVEPYFDNDDNSSSDEGSDLEFIRPDREWQGKVPE